MDLTKKEILIEIRKRFDQSILDGIADIDMKDYRFITDFLNTYFEKFSKTTLSNIYNEDFSKILHKFKEMEFDNVELTEGESVCKI